MTVFLSSLAESKLLNLTAYLLEHWSKKVKDEFVEKLTIKIQQIASQPLSCPQSNLKKGIFKCVVTKQSTFYYRILEAENQIEIITFFDSRQHPKRLKKHLK